MWFGQLRFFSATVAMVAALAWVYRDPPLLAWTHHTASERHCFRLPMLQEIFLKVLALAMILLLECLLVVRGF